MVAVRMLVVVRLLWWVSTGGCGRWEGGWLDSWVLGWLGGGPAQSVSVVCKAVGGTLLPVV